METEKMTNEKHRHPRFRPWAVAFALLLAADVMAQAPAARATAPLGDDMRLWSFGDCERRFPYSDTDEHKQCVRVVGSPEARDARALRVCEVSHATDHVEIDRCKAAYQTNKEKALKDGWAVNQTTPQQDVPPPDVMRRVKAITTAAVEDNRAAAQVPPPPAAATPAPASPAIDVSGESSAVTKVGVVLLLVALVGLGAGRLRRKQAQSA